MNWAIQAIPVTDSPYETYPLRAFAVLGLCVNPAFQISLSREAAKSQSRKEQAKMYSLSEGIIIARFRNSRAEISSLAERSAQPSSAPLAGKPRHSNLTPNLSLA
jgi:hypothetical protein